MTIERLTDEEREFMSGFGSTARVDKALRIIDQLTEALAAAETESGKNAYSCRRAVERAEAAEALAEAERQNCCDLIEQKACAEARVRELTEALAAAEQLASSRLKSFQDAYASVQHLQATVVDKEIAYDMACERVVSAENLARELEAQVEKLDGDFEETATELAALRERVAKADGELARANCLLLASHPFVARSTDQGLRGAINYHLGQRKCGFEDREPSRGS